MITDNLLIALYILFLSLGFMASLYDFIFYKIPNLHIVSIFLLFFIKALFFSNLHSLITPLVIFILLLLAGFTLYAGKIFGAGDAKFLAVSGLWMSEVDLSNFLILSGIFAGIISLLYVFSGKFIENLRKRAWSHMIVVNREKTQWIRFLSKRLEKPFIPNAVKEQNFRQVPIPFGVPIFFAAFTVILRTLGG